MLIYFLYIYGGIKLDRISADLSAYIINSGKNYGELQALCNVYKYWVTLYLFNGDKLLSLECMPNDGSLANKSINILSYNGKFYLLLDNTEKTWISVQSCFNAEWPTITSIADDTQIRINQEICETFTGINIK
jgi:hypothetical protein